jgi:hypothetical protein
VRASRTVVRPGRRDGGTTLIFRLSRPAVLRITVIRVYPSCKRFGSFTVRARSGVNRVRFRGRLRGRPLPPGGYRLVVRAKGAQRDAAAVPIVIERGKTTAASRRKARTVSVCSAPIADVGPIAFTGSGSSSGETGSGGSRLGRVKNRVGDSIAGVAGAVGGVAQSAVDRVGRVDDEDPFEDPFVLVVVGLLLGAIALLGTIFLAYLTRSLRLHGER